MSMSQEELRRRGLNFVRRQINAGKATKQDIDRWADELGDEVRQIAKEATPSKSVPAPASTTASKPDTKDTKES